MKKKLIIITLQVLLAAFPLRSMAQDSPEQNDPVKPALLVIDIQNAFLGYIPENEKEVAMYTINAFIKLFRDHDFPVICIYHETEEFGVLPGTDQFEYPVSVTIEPGDPRVVKTYPDGFNKTDLDRVIKESGSNTLFLCGLSAVGCVLATWIGAINHDYEAFILKDAIMSHKEIFTDNVEAMFDAVGYDVVKLILESSDP